ncbi:hypothetical protein M407DRAFT_32109 [Tulasnella calospora MUT 4182]|uniref:Uncharacterized protein n=1 Tax=Tulasnella calospora MUT 4182 TaxID=1051891 RepID=A0A0C3Q4J1_9AGAM|nr:hypothetical protein M407DRAFT_32109 [Tulasnella calospora MUT 4182]
MERTPPAQDGASRKRKNAAVPPPPSDRQTRSRHSNSSSGSVLAQVSEQNMQDTPERPRKRPRPRTRAKVNKGGGLEDILEEVEGENLKEQLSPPAVLSPTKNTENVAMILLGMGQVASTPSQRRKQHSSKRSLEVPATSTDPTAYEKAVEETEVNGSSAPSTWIEKEVHALEEFDIEPSEDDSIYTEHEVSPKRLPTSSQEQVGLSRAKKSRGASEKKGPNAPGLEVHYQITPRREKASKIVKMTSDTSYHDFVQRILTELAIPARKHEGRRLGIKMPDKRVSENPLQLTEDYYEEVLQVLAENAAAIDRGKRVNRKVPTVIDLKTYETELEEKEARRAKKKKKSGKGKKKANSSDDSDAPHGSDDDAATGPKKTMTKEEATELLHNKRMCGTHHRMCRVMPDGAHIPWGVDALTIWATLICEGQATPDEIPAVLKDDARPRVQESRRASSRDPTPAPPVPIEIKMIYPPFPGSSFVPNAPGASNTAHPPSSPTVPSVSSSDPLIEDFLTSLDEKWSGKDYRNFLQYLEAFNAEAMVRITELWAKDIRSQGADFYRQAPFKMPRGTANIFFSALKDHIKTLKKVTVD